MTNRFPEDFKIATFARRLCFAFDTKCADPSPGVYTIILYNIIVVRMFTLNEPHPSSSPETVCLLTFPLSFFSIFYSGIFFGVLLVSSTSHLGKWLTNNSYFIGIFLNMTVTVWLPPVKKQERITCPG